MEMIEFYWPNILAAVILVFVLGMVGRHMVARNQSMEVMLLGQEFQTSILMAALVFATVETQEHSDHGIHLEMFLSLFFVLIYHGFYLLIINKFRQYRIEGAILSIIMLMGFGQFIVLLSPLVEMHMVKSYLGDIVTVSKTESLSLAGLVVLAYIFLNSMKKKVELDTIEIALFNKVTKKRKSQLHFSIIVLILMLLSIHLFGSLFTMGAIIIPAFIAGFSRLSQKQYIAMTVINSLSVVGAFMMLTQFDRVPTTIFILFSIFFISMIYSIILKKS
jgi:ABC-type Mn2+/Zn2+ transport system permease subunit